MKSACAVDPLEQLRCEVELEGESGFVFDVKVSRSDLAVFEIIWGEDLPCPKEEESE